MPLTPDHVNVVTIQKLTDKEWEELYDRLLLVASRWISRRQFRVAPDPNDIASSAIEKTLSGRRPWNAADFTLLEHLCGVARSEISNLLTSHDNKLTSSLSGDAADGHELSFGAEPSIEDICIERDLIGKFLDHLSVIAPRLRPYASLRLVEGEHGARQCAERLNVTVAEIYRLTRQLSRRAAEFGLARNDGKAHTSLAHTSLAQTCVVQTRPANAAAPPDHDEDYFSHTVCWTCDGETSGRGLVGRASSGAGVLPLKCDGGHSDAKE